MATLITLVDGDVATVAPVNANFQALNTDIAGAMRTGYSSYSLIGNIGTGTDTLHTWTMPANTLTALGDGLRIEAYFRFAANANTKTVAMAVGAGTPITMNGTTAAPNSLDLHVSLTLVVATVGSGSLTVYGVPILWGAVSGFTPAFEQAMAGNATNIGSLASAQIVKFTGNATTTNDIIQHMMVISIFKAAV